MPPGLRTLIVGDVHGCLTELEALVAEARLRDHDAVISVGDLVAKGPDSAGVVAWMIARGARAVRGNHDQRVLDVAARLDEGDAVSASTHRDAATALDAAQRGWLAATPFYLELHALGVVVVHGGLVPGIPLPEQDPSTMMNLRSLRADGSPSKRIDDGTPWATAWRGPFAVFGHDAVRGLQRHPHAIGLDTGCVYGGRLTGLLLPERELVSVPAGRAAAPAG